MYQHENKKMDKNPSVQKNRVTYNLERLCEVIVISEKRNALLI